MVQISTIIFTHFKGVIYLASPFTRIVTNGSITTICIIQVLPLNPVRSCWGMLGLSAVFLLDKTVLNRTSFQVSPVCHNYSVVIVTIKLSMSKALNCKSTNSPYLCSETTNEYRSSLYQGKSGMIKLASMYPLYGIKIPHVPLRFKKPSRGRI